MIAMARGAFGHGETNGLTLPRPSGMGTAVDLPLGPEHSMEALLVSIATVAIAEMGDRTQLLSLVLAAHFRKPWLILAGVLLATLANHALAGLVGVWFGEFLTAPVLDATVGASMLMMALWALRPDRLENGAAVGGRGAFLATLIAFFIAEIGDKTQVATAALAAGYSSLAAVVAGTTIGMLAANAPVVFMGKAFADRLPMKAIHYGAAGLFALLGCVFIARALMR
jgi:putative Ca2+/H+ antiporter (TMEM165/GDT1 family)